MKRLLCLILFALFALSSCGNAAPVSDGLTVACMDFPSYDFARAVCGECANVVMVIPSNADIHSHTMTLSEVTAVQNCDLLIYNGGEGMGEIERVVSSAPKPIDTLALTDCVKLLEEELYEGMEEEEGEEDEEEFDVHVCTSPENAILLCKKICEKMCAIDGENSKSYLDNCEKYVSEIRGLQIGFSDFFETVENKVLIVGDVFPFRYFAEEFGIECYAAFPGCAEGDVAPSLTSLAVLSDKIRQYGVTTVFYVEFSSELTANCIASETGTETALLRACYSVERDLFDAGVTYVELMYKNLDALKEAMH